jgi:SH3 domain-containing YSC84-like protein 1
MGSTLWLRTCTAWSIMSLRPVLVLCACAVPLLACHRSPEPKSSASVSSADSPAVTEATERLDAAIAVLGKVGDKIPPAIAKRASCVVVIPDMVKGGLIVGARHGEGFATCRTATGWSAPAPVSISGASVGAQVGVESVDLVMLVNEEGKKKLLRSKLVLGADTSVAAGPVGKGREAGTTEAFKAELLSYSSARGLFAGAELSGATLQQDTDATSALYGAAPPDVHTLLSGEAPVPPRSRAFIDAVRDTIRRREAS